MFCPASLPLPRCSPARGHRFCPACLCLYRGFLYRCFQFLCKRCQFLWRRSHALDEYAPGGGVPALVRYILTLDGTSEPRLGCREYTRCEGLSAVLWTNFGHLYLTYRCWPADYLY